MKKVFLLLFLCSVFLFFNVHAASKIVNQDDLNLIGMEIDYDKLPYGFKILKKEGIYIKHDNFLGGIYNFMHVKNNKDNFLLLVQNIRIIDAIKVNSIEKEQLIKESNSRSPDPVFALINKHDYSVIKAWTATNKEGKIKEVPVKGIYCYDEKNPFLFTGCDPTGEASEKDLSKLIGWEYGPAFKESFPKGFTDNGGHILGDDYWLSYGIYKKSYVALLERFTHRDSSGHHA